MSRYGDLKNIYPKYDDLCSIFSWKTPLGPWQPVWFWLKKKINQNFEKKTPQDP